MQNAENKNIKMKFKLNYADKKSMINLSLRKNDFNSRNNNINTNNNLSISNTQNNKNCVANRSSLEKPKSTNATKNIKINIASSGNIKKSGISTNRVNNANTIGYLQNDSIGNQNSISNRVNNINNKSNISPISTISNINNINKVNIANNGIIKSSSGNTNNNENVHYDDSSTIGINEGKNFLDIMNITDSLNINDSINNYESLNNSGNINDYANNNNSSSVVNAHNNSNSNNMLHRNKYMIKSNLKIYYKNGLIPYSFIYHKILTILKSHYNNHISNNRDVANKGISFFHIENMLINLGFKGVDINNNFLLSYLASSKKIKIDLNEKRICYINPYVDITNITSLLNKINKYGYLYGYEINDDLINTNKEIYKWINTLLYEKKVRCIRSNNSHLRGKLKCKNLPTFCDIYSKNKCDNCFYNLKGFIFFPLSYEHIEKERYSITNDIKNLWDEITLPNLDNILKEYKLKSTNKLFINDNVPKRKNKDDKLTPIIKKMKRIYNTHLFTADEIKNEFIQKK
ncbi:conserved Apicomplexan protein [Plasmodium brasilianum]|nr:conserved Plasmodium protein, unknown function [Plasmodium malariae]KAI4836505.1 conserved Apicomplexan protein [Plasmodium brasilianum]SCO93781.1 conserved Plasmodium protein, unknown function [Plasmodium malariae]